MMRQVQYVAHRGGSSLAPENTLAAFRNALRYPVDAIELDVQMSSDGRAVVFHDETIERLTEGRGNILDLDFAYLRNLNAAVHFRGGWPEAQRIPTLREVLELAKGNLRVYIEIKQSKRDGVYGRYPRIAEAVVHEVRAMDMLDQVLVMSFDWGVLPLVRALEPGIQLGALVSNGTYDLRGAGAFERLVEYVRVNGWNWINLNRRLCRATMPSIAHAAGIRLGLWTVNTLRDMRRFAAMGVDSLTSDRPDLFSKL
jgi:glycerophosphoryl diester phosphodiesterase